MTEHEHEWIQVHSRMSRRCSCGEEREEHSFPKRTLADDILDLLAAQHRREEQRLYATGPQTFKPQAEGHSSSDANEG